MIKIFCYHQDTKDCLSYEAESYYDFEIKLLDFLKENPNTLEWFWFEKSSLEEKYDYEKWLDWYINYTFVEN